jgi:hypothetical protein
MPVEPVTRGARVRADRMTSGQGRRAILGCDATPDRAPSDPVVGDGTDVSSFPLTDKPSADRGRLQTTGDPWLRRAFGLLL